MGDPIISYEHIIDFEWLKKPELETIKNQCLIINYFLQGMFRGIGIKLVDFKVEFGKRKLDGKIILAACVGSYISAGYWFTSSTSFANPAVAIARTFTDSFTGIYYLDTPYYIIAELIGAIMAVYIAKKLIK